MQREKCFYAIYESHVLRAFSLSIAHFTRARYCEKDPVRGEDSMSTFEEVRLVFCLSCSKIIV